MDYFGDDSPEAPPSTKHFMCFYCLGIGLVFLLAHAMMPIASEWYEEQLRHGPSVPLFATPWMLAPIVALVFRGLCWPGIAWGVEGFLHACRNFTRRVDRAELVIAMIAAVAGLVPCGWGAVLFVLQAKEAFRA